MLIRENAEVPGLAPLRRPLKINEQTLKAIQEGASSDSNKVINLIKGLQTTVAEKGSAEPYLIPIGERVDAIREALEVRHIETSEALGQLEALAQERVAAQKAKRESGLEDETFAITGTEAAGLWRSERASQGSKCRL